jgi:adenine-specific DNA-methyltransferase
MATDPGDLVLDPTCGSGTTAYVAEQWGRRWITVDTSRVALALARTRLMSARFPYYLLADSPQGVKKEAEVTGQIPPTYPTSGDVKKGFVYKRVPHVTLKSIANNPDIKEGMTREQIDKAIARHAETELLFDQPYPDNSRIRVTGPFTVESLSPHRVLTAEPEEERTSRGESELSADELARTGDFTTMVLDNLRKSGVQNTKKGERLKFDTIVPYAGAWIHAVGEYADASGEQRRAALSIGPEYNAVSPLQIKEAAKEAVKGLGFDLLIVCGYAFDPHVSEEAKQYGALTVLPAKITEDLRMGEDMLKKTGAGNLFMVFGEPDLEIHREGGKLEVELRGIDIYDPTTGVIRGGRAIASEGYEQVDDATEDVACWFIDTNYNGESFFVRHAYFVGADKPYEKLAKTLRAQIDEAAWSSLYSTRSRPFDPPETGKIAVKVINHYGDEVLKVYAP